MKIYFSKKSKIWNFWNGHVSTLQIREIRKKPCRIREIRKKPCRIYGFRKKPCRIREIRKNPCRIYEIRKKSLHFCTKNLLYMTMKFYILVGGKNGIGSKITLLYVRYFLYYWVILLCSTKVAVLNCVIVYCGVDYWFKIQFCDGL